MGLDGSVTFMNTTSEGTVDTQSVIDPVKQILYTLLFVVSLIGNSLVIAAVYKNVNKKMRTTMNLFVVNMAVSDLLTTLIPLPMDMVLNIVGKWPIHRDSITGLVLCKLVYANWTLQSGVSILSLIVIALDRFWAVFFPTQRPVTTKKPVVVLSVIWIVCIGFQLPFLVETRVRLTSDGKRVCLPDFNGKPYARYFQVVQGVCFFFLPVIAIFVLYPAILAKLWRRQIPGNPSAANQELRDRTNRKVTFMAVALMISYVVAWFPLIVASFIVFVSPGYAEHFAKDIPFTFVLTYSSGALNPIICIVFNNSFRTAFVAIFRLPCGSNCTQVGNYSANNQGMANLAARFECSTTELDKVQAVRVIKLNRS